MPGSIGKRIRALRKEQGMTQSELAARAHIVQGYLSDIETANKMPTIDTVSQIAAALGVPTSDLMREKTCPLCGFEYNFAEDLASSAHQMQHDKAQRILETHGFYWPYNVRMANMNRAYSVLEDKYSSLQQKYEASVNLLKALFSRSVFAYARDDHPPFPAYVGMMLGKARRDYTDIPAEVIARLVSEYGRLDGMETGSYYQYAGVNDDNPVERDPQARRVLERFRRLSPGQRDALEEIIRGLDTSK